ncbi:hypothetical protein D0C16_20155 [Cellvibrio sp. KY-GH-1]|uniref:hypothetical protein n=1 Tax=Cellvibrio sp. KY-GH-1 TaxID=2303332 RepID=UPI0012485F68|nr:hypothetical protein [Cellvibrio sp. KY-GH-1]QEY18096.1 hypothetical protein D0C16_20155 [Cellvibrio sp. KY-GH-1]
MRSKGFHLSLALIASVGLITLTGCGGGDGDSARFSQTVDATKNTVTQIALTEDNITVHVQGTHQFKVNGLNAEGKIIADLTSKASWELSDKKLGTIKNGLFEGKNTKGDTGEVKLLVSYAGITDETMVTLTDANLKSVAVSHDSANASVDVCKNTSFKATSTFDDGKSYEFPLTWKITGSTPVNIASFPDVNSSTLSTKKNGVINVTATGLDNDKKEISSPEFQFTIAANLASVDLTPSESFELRQGQKKTIKVTGTYRDTSTADITKNASLTSSNTSALTVNSTTGEITAADGSAEGTDVTLTADCDGITKTLVVKVTKPDIQKIEIISSANTNATESLSISVGSKINPRIKVTYPTTTNLDPEVYKGTNSEWTFTNLPTGIDANNLAATVNANGEVTVEVKDSLTLTTSTIITLNTRLFDKNNKTIIGTDGSELKDSIQLTISP